ncbi:MAG: DUF4863 family protein, partial [Gammaproteobacteria bacterium]|nr:DUF4863 family protein [Gammaproteobacteria bacterium]
MSEISREDLQKLIDPVISFIAEKELDANLETELNREFPPDSPVYQGIEQACHDAIKAGWMCKYEADGIRFGRVLKPSVELNGFSVDVVDMQNIRGPHHRHPNGEIDMVMPIDANAKFDDMGAGWKVYQADSAHFPTVSEGQARVLL